MHQLEQHLSQLLTLEEINSSTDDEKETFSIEMGEIWMTPIFYYLTQGTLLKEKLEVERLKKPLNYGIVDEWLYRISYFLPWLKCINYENVKSLTLSKCRQSTNCHKLYFLRYFKAKLFPLCIISKLLGSSYKFHKASK